MANEPTAEPAIQPAAETPSAAAEVPQGTPQGSHAESGAAVTLPAQAPTPEGGGEAALQAVAGGAQAPGAEGSGAQGATTGGGKEDGSSAGGEQPAAMSTETGGSSASTGGKTETTAATPAKTPEQIAQERQQAEADLGSVLRARGYSEEEIKVILPRILEHTDPKLFPVIHAYLQENPADRNLRPDRRVRDLLGRVPRQMARSSPQQIAQEQINILIANNQQLKEFQKKYSRVPKWIRLILNALMIILVAVVPQLGKRITPPELGGER